MAIAYDTSGVVYSGTTTATVTLAAAASNEVAIMFVWYNDDTASWSGITVNGSSTGVTQIGTEYNAQDNNKMRMYYLVNPPTSSVNYTVTLSGTGDGMMFGVGIYSGVDTSTPIDSYNQSSPTTPFDIATTVVASNCWLVTHGRRFGGTSGPTIDSGTTRASIGSQQVLGDSGGTVSTGSQSLSYATDATYILAQIVSIKPSGGGGSSVSPSLSASASPSQSPSSSLSPSASLSPSLSPSASPSVSPSRSPSNSPSQSPSSSASPSRSPSVSPSQSPSASLSPSRSPSVSPSASPSIGGASASPSQSPSASASPSTSPSSSPSRSPSVSPSLSSSISPSFSPSISPSASSSQSPSSSASPSSSPSQSPSSSVSPSASPSVAPPWNFETKHTSTWSWNSKNTSSWNFEDKS